MTSPTQIRVPCPVGRPGRGKHEGRGLLPPGGPEVFGYEDVPDPAVPDDGVLVRVQAISIEGGDTLHRARDEVTATPTSWATSAPAPSLPSAIRIALPSGVRSHAWPQASRQDSVPSGSSSWPSWDLGWLVGRGERQHRERGRDRIGEAGLDDVRFQPKGGA